jgi:RNA-splicing ligase RtcB
VTPETIMIGTKGFRAREAAANYKRRERRLVSEEIRAVRFANLHGNADEAEVAEVVPAAAPVEPVKEAETDEVVPVQGAADGETKADEPKEPAAEVTDEPKTDAPKADAKPHKAKRKKAK